jgi:hypothetical protein
MHSQLKTAWLCVSSALQSSDVLSCADLSCAVLCCVLQGTPGFDPSTLYIPPAALSAMSDFGRQFWVGVLVFVAALNALSHPPAGIGDSRAACSSLVLAVNAKGSPILLDD